ncbi:MAG: exodeoxyribonuclease III [Hyphomicrobiales bacterium]|nr:exodeoxyribonuclease III [Hyphomicrobiales bacterium]
MILSVCTWNVNSVRVRLPGLARLAADRTPDVLCLQETKVEDALFPAAEIAAMGYPHQAIHGMKGYNGVAILSRRPLSAPRPRSWCGRDDRRHLQVTVDLGGRGRDIALHNVYLPAGGDKPNPAVNPRFAHKLDFMRAQADWWRDHRRQRRTVLVGDLNVAPLECDVWSHARLKNVVTHTAVEVEHLDAMVAAGGWVDAVRRLIPPPEPVFTWWSYRTPQWDVANKGRRLDHLWVTPDLEPALRGVDIVKETRGWDPPSDHVPVIVEMEI